MAQDPQEYNAIFPCPTRMDKEAENELSRLAEASQKPISFSGSKNDGNTEDFECFDGSSDQWDLELRDDDDDEDKACFDDSGEQCGVGNGGNNYCEKECNGNNNGNMQSAHSNGNSDGDMQRADNGTNHIDLGTPIDDVDTCEEVLFGCFDSSSDQWDLKLRDDDDDEDKACFDDSGEHGVGNGGNNYCEKECNGNNNGNMQSAHSNGNSDGDMQRADNGTNHIDLGTPIDIVDTCEEVLSKLPLLNEESDILGINKVCYRLQDINLGLGGLGSLIKEVLEQYEMSSSSSSSSSTSSSSSSSSSSSTPSFHVLNELKELLVQLTLFETNCSNIMTWLEEQTGFNDDNTNKIYKYCGYLLRNLHLVPGLRTASEKKMISNQFQIYKDPGTTKSELTKYERRNNGYVLIICYPGNSKSNGSFFGGATIPIQKNDEEIYYQKGNKKDKMLIGRKFEYVNKLPNEKKMKIESILKSDIEFMDLNDNDKNIILEKINIEYKNKLRSEQGPFQRIAKKSKTRGKSTKKMEKGNEIDILYQNFLTCLEEYETLKNTSHKHNDYVIHEINDLFSNIKKKFIEINEQRNNVDKEDDDELLVNNFNKMKVSTITKSQN